MRRNKVSTSLAFVTLVLILTSAQTSSAQPISSKQIADIDSAVRSAMIATEVPSISIALVREGRLSYSQAYGWARSGVRATTTARYEIGSNTKAFTAGALLLVAQQQGFSLQDKVSNFLTTPTRANEVSLQQILSHTAGYRDYWPQDYSFAAMNHAVAPHEITEKWALAPLDFDPGTRWQYSNTDYVIAGLIIEKAVGQSLFGFMQRSIFTPLGMQPVLVDSGKAAIDPVGYQRFAMGPVVQAPDPAPGWLYAAGDLAMSAEDLSRWDISILNRSLLSSANYDAMETETVLKNGAGTGYGLGLYVKLDKGRRILRHGGEAPGFLSENRIYPDDHAAIVVLVNADFADAQTRVADAIEKIIFQYSGHENVVRSLISDLRFGRIPEEQFTEDGKYYFRPRVLSDYRASLAAIGDLVDLRLRSSLRRGGFDVETYDAEFKRRNAKISILLDPGRNLKIEQFILTPKSLP